MKIKTQINRCSPKLDQSTLFQKNVVLGISIFNDFNQKELVEDQIKWLEQFSDYRILIGDYLYRHNYRILSDLNQLEYLSLCIKKGDSVFKNYAQYIKKSERGKIIFWKEQISNDKYSRQKKKICSEFEKREALYKSVVDSGRAFIQRRKPHLIHSPDFQALLKDCTCLIIEELALMASLCDNGYLVHAYNGNSLNTLHQISTGIIETESALKKGIFIDIETKKMKT